MEPTLFSFIWKYSKRQQIILLLVTLLTFPFLYITLELPKRIINDAIGAQTSTVLLLGIELTQLQFLLTLCVGFLAAILVSGLMKMRLNTMKGVLAERLLRRFRYQLLNRLMRFPKPYFRTTSQGELVAMVTSEAEPMGGLMGDAVAQPVFQLGQMLTIVTFLFMQSPWFGLASIALIPLQAWLIPMLQRQINLLNKDRIVEVRHLASEIGETAAGISDLRANGGWRYRLAVFTDRLGRLFDIRFQIYQKKFFMKFLNNFITQLTPFFFYLVGGYLAIVGQITVGALVAALAAYKDLSSPWKELLAYYNQVQDMSLRWEIVTERFAPDDMIDREVFDGEPANIPHLRGKIELRDVTVRDQDGNIVLEDITLDIPPGSRVAIQSGSASERRAFADLLTREILPSHGEVILSGHPVETLHQAVIAARVGYAHSRPYLFDGTLGDNLLMPLKIKPQESLWDPKGRDHQADEARRSGNSEDPLHAEWVDPGLAGLTSGEDIRDWWFKLVEAMGIDETMFRRMLRTRINPAQHRDLTDRIVALRPEIESRLQQKGLDEVVYRFEPDSFNPAVALGGNLLYASPVRDITQKGLASQQKFIETLFDHGLADEALEISQGVMGTLRQTFGRDGTDHPLFRRLGMEEHMYHQLTDLAEKRARLGDDGLSHEELSLMITVPFLLTAEQIGPSFPDTFKEKILSIRRSQAHMLREMAGDLFVPVSPDTYVPRLTVVENAIFGRVSIMAGAKVQEIENEVAAVLIEHGLRQRVAAMMYDMPAGLGGANLPTVLQERAAFSRAGIKRPDILILDRALASHDSKSRLQTRMRLRELLPKSVIIFIEDRFDHPENYDLFVEIKDGRIDGVARLDQDDPGTDDFRRKLRIIAGADLFSRIDSRNQRLLAFSAQWYESKAGQIIFAEHEPADAAYLCLEGRAELRVPDTERDEAVAISVVEPGRLIGDLAIILREPRQLTLVSLTDAKFLRIGAQELRDVMESDASVAVSLLETVAGHLTGMADVLRASQVNIADFIEHRDGVPVVTTDKTDRPVEA